MERRLHRQRLARFLLTQAPQKIAALAQEKPFAIAVRTIELPVERHERGRAARPNQSPGFRPQPDSQTADMMLYKQAEK